MLSNLLRHPSRNTLATPGRRLPRRNLSQSPHLLRPHPLPSRPPLLLRALHLLLHKRPVLQSLLLPLPLLQVVDLLHRLRHPVRRNHLPRLLQVAVALPLPLPPLRLQVVVVVAAAAVHRTLQLYLAILGVRAWAS